MSSIRSGHAASGVIGGVGCAIALGFLVAAPGLAFRVDPPQPSPPWEAPARAAKKANPVKADDQSISLGKRLFERECASCHGLKGLGDGPKAPDLERKPGNLSLPAIAEQSDGALFWKISEGKAPMPAVKALISEDERWHVINYLRTLAAPEAAPTPPQYAAPETHRKAVSAVIRAYDPVRAALAGKGDGAAASRGVSALVEAVAALQKADAAPLPAGAKDSWASDAAACADSLAALKSAGDDLVKLRQAFGAVSVSVIGIVERYGHAEPGPVLVFVESTAKGDNAPSWLQTDSKAQDPYSASTDKQSPVKRLGGQRKS